MRYREFERIISAERMSRYVEACGGNTRKAMTLYKYNIELSQVMLEESTMTWWFRSNGIKSLLLMLLLLVMGVGESVGVFPRVLVFYRIIGKIGV